MSRTERLAFSAGKALAIGAAAAGAWLASPALADTDNDPKMRDNKPAVVHPIVYYRAAGGDPVDGPNFAAKNVQIQTWIPLSGFPGFPGASADGADCWGYVSPSGREYALMGLSWGNGIVEITNPANPTIVTVVPGGVNVLWRDITVVGTRCYAVSDSQGVGIQVMDLANIDAGQVQFIGNVAQGGHSTTHTLLSNPDSGWLYCCGGNATSNGGCQPTSTANPNSPAFVGPGFTSSYVHEAQIVNYTSGPYAGKEVAFLFLGGNGLAIVDVTNKNAPVNLSASSVLYPGESYSHQGWISPDKKYLYHNDEIDGPTTNVPRFLTRVFNIENLSNPRLCATFNNGLGSVDHNEYVHNGYLYQSNYRSGLRVWDLADPLRPVEVAHLDTYPEDDVPPGTSTGTSGYNGCWGNYAMFPSGTVIASDIERGLFIVKVSILKLSPASTPAQLTPGQATPITVNVAQRDATVNPASVKMHVSVNGGSFSPIAMASIGGGAFSGNIPAGACNDRVRWYFSAETTDVPARTFTWPLTAPAEYLGATVRTGETTHFSDNFQNNLGWTVSNTAVTAGAWVRAVPAANGGQGAAIGDADGSGMAYVTGNGADEDLDGGPTRLLSPLFNLASQPEAVVTYSRWVLSIQGTTDNLITEVSNNDGASWTQVESLGPSSGAWQKKSFRVADFVAPTSQVRVRFSITDTGTPASQTEAGVDAFSIASPTCPVTCYPDCNGVGGLTVADFACFQTRFVAGDPYADCNGVGGLTIADFGCFQTEFVQGCP